MCICVLFCVVAPWHWSCVYGKCSYNVTLQGLAEKSWKVMEGLIRGSVRVSYSQNLSMNHRDNNHVKCQLKGVLFSWRSLGVTCPPGGRWIVWLSVSSTQQWHWLSCRSRLVACYCRGLCLSDLRDLGFTSCFLCCVQHSQLCRSLLGSKPGWICTPLAFYGVNTLLWTWPVANTVCTKLAIPGLRPGDQAALDCWMRLAGEDLLSPLRILYIDTSMVQVHLESLPFMTYLELWDSHLCVSAVL